MYLTHPSIRFAAFFVAALIPFAASALQAAQASQHSLRSPAGRIEVTVKLTDRVRYDVQVDATAVVTNATLMLDVDGKPLGIAPTLKTAGTRTQNGTIKPVVRQKAATLKEQYNELRLEMLGDYALVFRAYDEGVAYRWETSFAKDRVVVRSEEVGLNFAGDYVVYYPEEEGFFSHNERHFLPRALGDLAAKNIASIPAIVDARAVKIAIADAGVDDYPGLWLRGTSGRGLAGVFPQYPLTEQVKNDRDVPVTKTADHIAVTKGTRSYPWRVLGVAHKDGDLVASPLVYLLGEPSRIADTSWIKPGKVAWDWWNANNLSGVDFKSGVNTASYKAYIDFAAKHGIEYIILDEGWYKLGNLLQVVPEISIEEIVAHGKAKNVGVILWVVWKTLDDQLQPALDQFERWGIKGIKVDFMQRDDQPIINYYHKICAEAAKRHMLVDFHGAIRPAAMTRTWPNLISTEGVRGLEWCKWSAHITPEHDVTLPFTRMFVGPMDFTPGAMLNTARKEFAIYFDRPRSQGTRCHQLAMYVVYESPLQMLADSPGHYAKEPEAMAFLGAVPSVWDESRVLDGRIADYVLVARRSGAEWFIGAMTDWNSRELEVDLSFLPPGKFSLTEWRDGANADRQAEDCRVATHAVDAASKLRIRLAEGGGWAARIRAK